MTPPADHLPAADRLGDEVRRRLGPVPDHTDWPSISIVVLSRDGAGHLRRLVAGLVEHTDYPLLELIFVDNASSDDSLDLMRGAEAPFPISILANAHNESFSTACNQGAELATGGLLLFLNNDAVPFEPGWLRELVSCLRDSGAAAAGPTLLQPDEDDSDWAYVVQQRGLRVRYEGDLPVTTFRDHLADPLGEGLGRDVETASLAAACLLIERDVFWRVGGFSAGYWYGPEDADLALKLLEAGLSLVVSGRSLLIHPLGSTLRSLPAEQRNAWIRGNRRLFMERWGPRVRREYELDRLQGGGLWAEPDASAPPSDFGRAEWESLGFCLWADHGDSTGLDGADAAAPSPLEPLCAALRERGHRCLLQRGAGIDDLAPLTYDVAVYLRGSRRYVPRPAQLNVLWPVGGEGLRIVSARECSQYDVVVGRSAGVLDRLREEGVPAAKLAVLEGDDASSLADALLAAVGARVEATGFRTRIGRDPAISTR